ncbi:MAG: cyclophilin-like fold protein [bacterium]|nr:cyclophilin-like fold protein [bacterium]
MARRVQISAGKTVAKATLLEGETSARLWDALPIEGTAQIWGDEIYFAIPLEAPAEPGAREEMAVGEIAYWPPGKAFCIFFGPTPASTGNAPRAASAVNPLGRIEGDARIFRDVPGGAAVKLERVE